MKNKKIILGTIWFLFAISDIYLPNESNIFLGQLFWLILFVFMDVAIITIISFVIKLKTGVDCIET